jgi:hypothetical protein
VRYFRDGYTKLGSIQTTIGTLPSPTSAPQPTPPSAGPLQSATSANGLLTIRFSQRSGQAATDWIAYYTQASDDVKAYKGWKYINNTQTYTPYTPSNTTVTIPVSMTPASYVIRYFKDGYTLVGQMSSTAVVEATPTPLPPTPSPMPILQSAVTSGGTMTVTFSKRAGQSLTDWIGYYASAQDANTAFLGWKYINNRTDYSGTMPADGYTTITMPVTNSTVPYHVRYFRDGYTLLDKISSVSIPPTPTATAAPVSNGPITAAYYSNNTVTVDFTIRQNQYPADWIGVYSTDSTVNTGPLGWKYINNTQTSTVTTNTRVTIPVSTGASVYYVRYFENNGYTVLGKMTTINAPPPSIPGTLKSATVDAQRTLTVTFTPTTTLTDWIGIYPNATTDDRSYSAFKYVTNSATATGVMPIGGFTSITFPTISVSPGSEVRYFRSGYTRLGTLLIQ